MSADKTARAAEEDRLADRALAALRAGKIDDFRILLAALHELKGEDDKPLPF